MTTMAPHRSTNRLGLTLPSIRSLIACIIALTLSIPIIVIVWSIFQPGQGNWPHLVDTVLPQYIINSLILMLSVGAGVAVIGVGTAWLVVMCRFPGRKYFEWALILPLAVPAYVVAYAYTDVLQVSGPIQSLIRDTFDLRFGDYWFPNVRTFEGAIMIFIAVLYPYVYLLARAAFLEQSICALDAARTLGRTPWGAFRSVALPLARPAVVAGTALALMETLADFGTVAHFGIPTFATGIYRTWASMGDQIAAAQLSSVLLMFVVLLVWIERMSRKQSKYHHTTGRYQQIERFQLNRLAACLAFLFCFLPLLIGFLAPLVMLIWMHLVDGHNLFSPRYLTMIWNSISLAGITAFLAIVISMFLVYVARSEQSWYTRISNRIVSFGYAIPGSMIAVGILIPLASFDNVISDFLAANFNISVGLVLTGSIAALVLGYLVRFMTVSMNSVQASLDKVTPNMEFASRSLGYGPAKTALKVHVPIISGGLLTAGLIVFVDVMKELPATLIMRPFNFDTLAVQAYNLASDERLAQAATPSLVIVGVGVLPLIIMSRAIMKSRPGSTSQHD